ncbi:hypothetical protein GCM10011360_04770 [Primorskyibacter flagellatus]|uniref:Uncharacterized protein n=1 Tax=Primorskyibacter flagellatus TaxID=1387277 RepID=A0A916ZYM5_9RHOB|nr:hypothetical protein GCM10011360_04770 [Primorskyibacter flagellatus]
MIPARNPSPDFSTPSLTLPLKGEGTPVTHTMPPSKSTLVVALPFPSQGEGQGGGLGTFHTRPRQTKAPVPPSAPPSSPEEEGRGERQPSRRPEPLT